VAEPQDDEAGQATRLARYAIGDVVKHRVFPFRGVIFDVDPEFDHSEEWWLSIPEAVRPRKDQPFYHVLAENAETTYEAYVSEQNLLPDFAHGPCRHPGVEKLFVDFDGQRYRLRTRFAQ
jgi:heat shock protein HspQ